MSRQSSHRRSAVILVVCILTLLGSGFALLAPHAKTRPDGMALVTHGSSDQPALARKDAPDAAFEPPPVYQPYNLTSDGQ